MFDYREFVSRAKSLLIAPAGYGKTHTIAECLKYTEGKQLVLTHTHAGVASLKEKIKNEVIPTNKCHVETINSFAQKYVLAFYCGDDIPEQESSKEYFRFIIQKATQLVQLSPIKEVIKATYSGLFVDEYQDCTIIQHQFLSTLSNLLPLHALGDPLQGIFGFGEDRLIDWELDLSEFDDARFELTEPWRWKNTNPSLGLGLKAIREKLENHETIDLSQYETVIETSKITDYSDRRFYRSIHSILNSCGSLLLIHPESHNINARKRLVKNFKNRFYLVEAVDGRDFYEYAKIFDESDSENIYHGIRNLILNIFNKSEINKWFNTRGAKNKQGEVDKRLITPIKACLDDLDQKVCIGTISKTLKLIGKLPSIKCYRKELFSDLCKALDQAEFTGSSVYEAMKRIRNVKRRMGRKIEGNCIGTTLLTKGLEFDTVIILDAHKFNCPKNFYVALTRATARLVVFTKNKNLSPYAKE